MDFKAWLEAFEQKHPYKKRRPGAVTGAAKMARRGGGIAAVVNPANLSKPDNDNPAGQVYKGMTVAGPNYQTTSKIHEPIAKQQRYFQDPYRWNTFDATK